MYLITVNVDNRQKPAVSSTLRAALSPGKKPKPPYAFNKKLGWPPSRSGKRTEKSLAHAGNGTTIPPPSNSWLSIEIFCNTRLWLSTKAETCRTVSLISALQIWLRLTAILSTVP